MPAYATAFSLAPDVEHVPSEPTGPSRLSRTPIGARFTAVHFTKV